MTRLRVPISWGPGRRCNERAGRRRRAMCSGTLRRGNRAMRAGLCRVRRNPVICLTAWSGYVSPPPSCGREQVVAVECGDHVERDLLGAGDGALADVRAAA